MATCIGEWDARGSWAEDRGSLALSFHSFRELQCLSQMTATGSSEIPPIGPSVSGAHGSMACVVVIQLLYNMPEPA